jgi:hypothetical protein
MKRVAIDECRHAELSARIGAYLDTRLTAEERGRVRAAAMTARAELEAEIARAEVDPELARVAGVPTRREARMLLEGLDREILQRAA